MEITSYPGPVDGIRPEHLVPGRRVPSVPARNRRIGELLKELRLCEGRGTGVPSMYEDMRTNGSPPPEFDFDEARSYFRVTLPAHPEYVVLDALRDATRLKMVGERSAATRRLEDAFWAQPRSAGLARAVVEELGERELLERARAVFEAFVGTGPDLRGLSSVALAWAKTLLDAGERDEGQAVLDRVDPEALAFEDVVDAAIQERRLGRYRHAHRSFTRVADQLVADARALHELAQTKLAIAREPGPGEGPEAASAGSTAAGTLDAQARRALLLEARGLLERVLQLGAPVSRHAWASFHLGQALEALGAPRSEARLAYAEASRRLPDQQEFTEALGRLRLTPDDDP